MTQHYTHRLRQQMQAVGFSSFKALGQVAGVSDRQVKRLRRGKAMEMQVAALLRLSHALQMPLLELLRHFSESPEAEFAGTLEVSSGQTSKPPISEQGSMHHVQELAALRQEYDRLQTQLDEQRKTLWQEFQQSCLQVLEPWMLQFPTAAYAAQNNPQVPAVKLLPLMRPVEQLLQTWEVTAIAPVGTEIPFDPHQHQLMEGVAEPGAQVKVRYTGYLQANKLLYRAKVSPVVSAGIAAS
ncbi:MAG: hypothetical protein KME16_08985 [Scytolyngbya sp. HA4215-MV1]|jgi:molecular chaperone GrpE (heat shock protein)|nr:hypothetical protein [Scytolyngbya sp. HA4215-MV1]